MRKSDLFSSGIIKQLVIGVIIGAAFTSIILWGLPPQISSETEAEVSLEPVASNAVQNLAPGSGVLVGAQAPNFQLPDIHEQIYELSELKGTVVLLNFWATWCGPCRLEMPLLERHSEEVADQELIILAINLGEPIADVKAYIAELGLSMPILIDQDGVVSSLYRIIGYPSTIVIDPEGRIHAIHIGILTEPQLHDYLEQVGLSL